jgi:hypothetical protein
MVSGVVRRLQPFGVRSLITHVIMALGLSGAVISAFFIDGEVGRLSFVALFNFTAGMWICQSIHSLGNPDYKGIIHVVRSRGE